MTKPWPALPSSALFTDAKGVTWAFGDDGDHYAVPDSADRVLELPGSVLALARDAHGVAWLGMSARHPLVCFDGQRFEAVKVPRAISSAYEVARLAVRGADDVMIASSSDDEEAPHVYAERIGGKWQEVELPIGAVNELVATEGATWVALARTFDTDRAGALLVKKHGAATFKSLAFPRAAGRLPSCVGLGALPDGSVVVLTAEQNAPVLAWRVNEGGKFRRLPVRGKLVPWVRHIASALHGNTLMLATNGGVFACDGKAIARVSTLKSFLLFRVADGLVARGWRNGEAAHEILRDGATKWAPYEVPLPGVVFGGHGKVVHMPPRKKVPVVRVRISAPRVKAAPTPKVKITPLTMSALLAHAKSGEEAWPKDETDIAAQLARTYGVKVAPDLRRWLGAFKRGPVRRIVGLWRTWDGKYFPLPDVTSGATTLATVWTELPSIISALTGTWALGADGGGQVFFAELDRRRSEVFIYGPGVGELKLIAKSFTAFAALNLAEENWERFCTVTGFDDEDLDEGAIDARTPGLAKIRQQARSLRGKVHLPGMDTDMESDYDALFTNLAGKRLVAKSASKVLTRYRDAYWLVSLLGNDYVPSRAMIRLPRGADRAPEAGTRVLALWHAYFVGEGGRGLERALERARNDRAPLVRGTAMAIDAVLANEAGEAFARIATLRAATRKELGLA